MTTRPSIHNLAKRWLELDPTPATRKEIEDLLKANSTDELELRLREPIKFGTAGLRAPMKAGFACMNDLTVIQASQGLADYISKTVPDALTRGVVIGHDHRHHSRSFARLTASVFLHWGFQRVILFRRNVHTPMVPFTVKLNNMAGGVMITASHNPKEDNGYKVYWENGCQIIPPHDKGIAGRIEALQEPREKWGYDDCLKNPACVDMTEALVKKYHAAMGPLCHFRHGNMETDLKVVYTAMHGVGKEFALHALNETFGFPVENVHVVAEQSDVPDPDFPTVKFPNPEEAGALDMAIALATKKGAQLVLANDPDADRFACAEVWDDADDDEKGMKHGGWHVFTGDQIGVMLAAATLELAVADGCDVGKVAMAASTVSSKMVGAMAEEEGFRFEETLTGFKWMSNRLLEVQSERKRGDPASSSGDVRPLFAYEEAIGFMCQPDAVLDKDGVSALCVFVEKAVRQRALGSSMWAYLQGLYQKYGYHASSNHYFISRDPEVTSRLFRKIRFGAEDESRRVPRTNFLREKKDGGKPLCYPSEIAGVPVTGIRDLTVGFEIKKMDTSRRAEKEQVIVRENEYMATLATSASSEMITFTLANGCIFTLRTSGTEPKIKYYIEMKGNADNKDEVHKFLDAVVKAIKRDLFYDLDKK
ncbi:Phosphoglucomutase-3 [Irineochytrium annulatum]|nr:Phosphoglucomutase-3 [Irineochytrium annulatum]